MSTKEQIPTTIELGTTPPRRISPAEKARQLLQVATPPRPEPRFVKLTTRINPEQMEWLKREVRLYRDRHTRAPRLSLEELTRVALELLRQAPDIDALIEAYRS